MKRELAFVKKTRVWINSHFVDCGGCSNWSSHTRSFKYQCHSYELLLSICAGRGVKVEAILKDDETLTSFLLRDVPLTESVVYHLVNAQIRPEQVHRHTYAHI